ncbi:phosphate ABC transporter substrate-binding protein [Dictyobacter alpinus]|uniref:Phosphate ABC transporter substrate-binding protein n=1 Tax=Dictyobacter alpinus TaxID=2014873 RepID=A0A402B420_9CHLR|nr:substrate-binding domain-containing protein [Dictyobacter alpinus]GCE26114.1 phosphate ABC transporter substrate-binding protein [Dictyobacter alpinus]
MLTKWRIAIILTALAMLSVLMTACGSDTTAGAGGTPTAAATTAATTTASNIACEKGNLGTGGSTALGPLVQAAAKTYQDKCSGSSITTQLTGSGAGLKGVHEGSLQVGNSDSFVSLTKNPEYKDLTDNQVAVVVFAVIVNKDVTGVTDLTSDQIKGIFTGKITNWKEVKGPDLQISVISRPDGSGTRNTFEKYVLGGTKESVSGASHSTAKTSGDVASNVSKKTGSISYDTVDFAKKNSLTVVKIDGQEATADNVKSNAYKFWNIEHMYTKGAATGLAKSFIDFVKGADAASLRQQYGFLDLSSISSDAITAKTPKA